MTFDNNYIVYLPKASSQRPPLAAGDNAFLGDIISSSDKQPKTPITSGFYRQEKGKGLVYTYPFCETKIILEGHIYVKDESGEEIKAVPGDVIHFSVGSTVTFRSDDYGLAFFTAQR